MPTGILEVKLGSACGMPTKRLVKLLEGARRDCCKARNAAMLHWYVWRREHPDWEPGVAYEAPAAKVKRKVNPDAKVPKDSPVGPRLFLSRELYAAAREAAPNLSANVASSCVQEVIARLKSNTPYDHDGEARWVWQAILDHEVNLPTWRNGRIPMPRKDSVLTYDVDRCALRFPLLSKQSGWKTLSPPVRLLAGSLTRGNRLLLREMAAGSRRMADSQITERKGKWYAQLCYEVPVSAAGADPERIMVLEPAQPEDRMPLLLRWKDADGDDRVWWIGKARPLVAEYRRVVARRRAIRYRYSDDCGKGHGRQRWYKSIRPMARAVVDMQARFEKQTVSDIVKFCLRANCGKLVYREPTKPVRERCWFAAVDVPYNWVSFEARLKFKAECAGLEYENRPRMRMAEWLPPEKQKRRDAS